MTVKSALGPLADDDLGGTWRDNSYPGLTCDIPSHLYSFSFRPWRWSRRFPPREEILAYLHALVAERGLGPHLRFGCGVAAADFDEHRAVWNLTLDDGGTLQARVVVCALGQLGRPALPDIAGRDGFAGPSWHSGRWNHDAVLAGKRVAVVGTGASAIQFVPEIAKVAGHVDVYQRSAPYVLAPMLVSGLGGRRLQHAWQDGPQAYLGIAVSGFPNFFMLYGPNTNLGGNSIIYMLESQIGYVLDAIQALQAERLAWIDVRPEVQDAFNSWVQSASRTSVWETGCHNWYTTASGRNTNNWPAHTFMYRYQVRRFDLAAYRVMPAMAGTGAA